MERDWFTVGWKMLLVRGVIGMVFGILAIVWPIETATALALLWGFWALVDGIGLLVGRRSGRSRAGAGSGWSLLGVIALVAAFFAITSPGSPRRR